MALQVWIGLGRVHKTSLVASINTLSCLPQDQLFSRFGKDCADGFVAKVYDVIVFFFRFMVSLKRMESGVDDASKNPKDCRKIHKRASIFDYSRKASVDLGRQLKSFITFFTVIKRFKMSRCRAFCIRA